MVAPVSVLCFFRLAWKALWIRYVHFTGCTHSAHGELVGHLDGDVYGDGMLDVFTVGSHGGDPGCGTYPSRAVYTYAGLSIVMQVQATCAICAALAVRGGRLESYSSGGSRSVSVSGGRSSRKGGWRKRINAEGRAFYEHRRTGRVQYGSPVVSSDVEEGRSSDMSGCEGRLCRVDET